MTKGDNKRKIGEAERAEMVRLYATPSTDGTWVGTTTIGRVFGVRPETVRTHLLAAGVTLRSARESHAGGKRCRPLRNLPVGDAPLCKCGCGEQVVWNRPKNRWNVYVSGHYHPERVFHQREWLEAKYHAENLTVAKIAEVAGVSPSAVAKAMKKTGVVARDRSASRMGRKVGPLNGAWKGGVADWSYSSDWKVLARQIRNRDQWRCQDCGEQRKRWGHSLHVHHIDGQKLNNEPSNLVSLCAACHRERHRHMAV